MLNWKEQKSIVLIPKKECKLKCFNFILVSMGSTTFTGVGPNEVPPEVIIVNNDEIVTSRSPYKICTSKVSSCLVVTLYDSDLQIGSLSHVMPYSRHLTAKNVIEKQLADMQLIGSKCNNLWAKLIGEGGKCLNKKNRVVKKKLCQYSIPVLAEDLGGEYMRNVVFDLKTGEILVLYLYQLGWRTFLRLNKTYL